MSAAQVLKAARTAGVHRAVDGDDLGLEASVPPPAAVLTSGRASLVPPAVRPPRSSPTARLLQFGFRTAQLGTMPVR